MFPLFFLFFSFFFPTGKKNQTIVETLMRELVFCHLHPSPLFPSPEQPNKRFFCCEFLALFKLQTSLGEHAKTIC